MLRQFLYLDRDLIRDLLAQVEGGTYTRQKGQTSQRLKGKASGGIKLPVVRVRGSIQEGTEETAEVTWEQTSASEFDRLYEYLVEDGMTSVPPIDSATWASFRRGSFIEAEVETAPSPLQTLERLASAAGQYVAFAEATGQAVDDEARSSIALIQAISSLTHPSQPTLVMTIAGEPDYKFRVRLNTEGLRVPLAQLDGEAIVVAKIGRVVAEGQRLEVENLLSAMQFIDEDARRNAENALEQIQLGSTSMGSLSLTHPAADLVPVAIFR